MKLRRIASKIYRKFEYLIKRCVSSLIRALTLKSNKSITLTFDADSAVDGTGAQLQRLISVYALARYFGFKYEHTEIKQVSVHPLDPFQTKELYSQYLKELNAFIRFSRVEELSSFGLKSQSYTIEFWSFMMLLLKNSFSSKSKKFSVLEPYPVTEFSPSALLSIRDECELIRHNSNGFKKPYIALHYRQGVGGFVLYPGQNISRETPLVEFEEVIESILSEAPDRSLISLVVLTDAPTSVTYYEPPQDQQHLWVGTPGYFEGKMTIQPLDFEYLTRKFNVHIEVIRGGNPLVAIEVMAKSDYLLMGKSSLSYVGALLNKSGKVYSPRDFWHRPLPGWRKF